LSRGLPSFPTRRSSDLGRLAATTRFRWERSESGGSFQFPLLRSWLNGLRSRDGSRMLPLLYPDASKLDCGGEFEVDAGGSGDARSEEHTSELQSRENLV